MVSFNPEDVIFLLNRWDTMLEDDEKDEYFESTKTRIRSIWKKTKDTRILKLSMNKVKINLLFNSRTVLIINVSVMCYVVI